MDGSETWTLRKEILKCDLGEELKKPNLTEMLIHELILRNVNKKRFISTTVFKEKINWIKNILRRNCVLHVIIKGHMDGLPGRVIRKVLLLDDLKKLRTGQGRHEKLLTNPRTNREKT